MSQNNRGDSNSFRNKLKRYVKPPSLGFHVGFLATHLLPILLGIFIAYLVCFLIIRVNNIQTLFGDISDPYVAITLSILTIFNRLESFNR